MPSRSFKTPKSPEQLLFATLRLQPASSQSQSPFFAILPGEVRNSIYEYALSDFEDLTAPYQEQTCYRRPNYNAPRKISTAILRTCRQAYLEAWALPWMCSEYTFYLTADDRRPLNTMTFLTMQKLLNRLHRMHALAAMPPPSAVEDRTIMTRSRSQFPWPSPFEAQDRLRKLEDILPPLEVDSIRVFPQMYNLEPGIKLGEILFLKHFAPRRITITIRHTDWWHWESDHPLRIQGRWARNCILPASTRELTWSLRRLSGRRIRCSGLQRR